MGALVLKLKTGTSSKVKILRKRSAKTLNTSANCRQAAVSGIEASGICFGYKYSFLESVKGNQK